MADGGWKSRWPSVGAAAIFAVAAAAAVAGGKLTRHLTLGVVMFAALVAIGMLLTYLVDRRTKEKSQTGNASGVAESSAKAARVDARGARGVQIGNGNMQQNYFTPDHDNDAGDGDAF